VSVPHGRWWKSLWRLVILPAGMGSLRLRSGQALRLRMTSTSWASCFAEDDKAYFRGAGSLRPAGLIEHPPKSIQSTTAGHSAAPRTTNRMTRGEGKVDARGLVGKTGTQNLQPKPAGKTYNQNQCADLACLWLQASDMGITGSPGSELPLGSPPEQCRSRPGPPWGSENHTLRRRWR